jgi:hypothetical protein
MRKSFVCGTALPALLICTAIDTLLLSACARSPSSQIGQPAASASTRESSATEDVCSLLDPKEVAAVLAAPLAVQPFLSRDGKPVRGGSTCKYEDANLHSVTIDVEWENGAMMWKMVGSFQAMADQGAKGLVHLADGSDLAGEWDEARVQGCCRFMALRGDQLVTIDVGATKATIASAARLADAALKRLDKPLPIEGSKSVKAAMEFETATRPKPRNPCNLISRPEAEALIGPLAAEPTSDDKRCEYARPANGTVGPVYVLKVTWTGGFGEFRESNTMFGTLAKDLSKSMQFSGNVKEAVESPAVGSDLPANSAWEAAHYNIAGLTAVKKDVLISIEPQAGSSDDALKLMERAMSKL